MVVSGIIRRTNRYGREEFSEHLRDYPWSATAKAAHQEFEPGGITRGGAGLSVYKGDDGNCEIISGQAGISAQPQKLG